MIIGIDGCGNGAWCGPLVVAAVALPEDAVIKGVRDSKKVSAYRRADLDPIIRERALHWVIVQSSASQIDQYGLAACENAAMLVCAQRCLERAPGAQVIVDGTRHIRGLKANQKAIAKADDLFMAVSAASIIAKLHRDRWMMTLAAEYPLYDLHSCKGYGTKVHGICLRKHGPCPEHRMSYAPVATAAKEMHRPLVAIKAGE